MVVILPAPWRENHNPYYTNGKIESILEACNVPESILDEGTMALSGCHVFLLLVLSFTPSSSSSSPPAKSDITGIFLRMCDTPLRGAHGPWQAEACVRMNVCPLEVSPSLFLQL